MAFGLLKVAVLSAFLRAPVSEAAPAAVLRGSLAQKSLSVTVTEDASRRGSRSLLQSAPPAARVSATHAAHASDRNAAKEDQAPAAWFGGFAQGESTYEAEGELRAGRPDNPNLDVLEGWSPVSRSGSTSRLVKGEEWFHESPSGASLQAWQTHFPAIQTGLASQTTQLGEWHQNAGGQWHQDYRDGGREDAVPASWFDSSVNQYDGFGRRKEPTPNLIYWQERSVNTTLVCKDPGCIANVSLQAPFNASGEQVKNCRLSVFFHPTDFDEDFSGERVEWIEVNTERVNSQCFPMASGCNASAGRPLIPCLLDLDLERHMTGEGTIYVAAKIPTVVDECPYENNLLSAVPMITCLVGPKDPPPPALPALPVAWDSGCVRREPLRCRTRGCTAEATVDVLPTCKSCTLTVSVEQTDYDQELGSDERIEFVQVNGFELVANVTPGKNPCRDAFAAGTNLSNRTFSVLASQSLASYNATPGRYRVSAKISDFVDECASNGYLFDGLAEVSCASGGYGTANSTGAR